MWRDVLSESQLSHHLGLPEIFLTTCWECIRSENYFRISLLQTLKSLIYILPNFVGNLMLICCLSNYSAELILYASPSLNIRSPSFTASYAMQVVPSTSTSPKNQREDICNPQAYEAGIKTGVSDTQSRRGTSGS